MHITIRKWKNKDYKSAAFINIRLLLGTYYINLGLYDGGYKEYDVIWNAQKFYINDADTNGESGVFQMEHQWIY